MFDTTQTGEITEPTPLLNSSTKAELLSRAKAAIKVAADAGAQSLHEAAELLAIAKKEHGASQREIAEAVGMSAAWVNRLLRWHQSGYEGDSPFGPTTKAGRVQHAKQRPPVSKPRRPKATASMDASMAVPGDADMAASSDASKETSTEIADNPSRTACREDAEALGNFKYAVNVWFPKMSDEAKREAINYAVEKSGVRA